MPQLAPITKQIHTTKSWIRFTTYSFASKNHLAFLAGAEIGKAVSALPMAFVKQQELFSLVAVLSLTPGTNLFVAPDGRWLGGYIPAAFRGYPFSLVRKQGSTDLVLCVDEDSGLVTGDLDQGEPFFDAAGGLTKPVQDILNFLQQTHQNRKHTDLAVAALAEAGVILPWSLKVQDKAVTGLYRIDETSLNRQDDQAFAKLRKAGSLPIAYAQLFSMANIQVFDNLIKIREQMKEPEIDKDFLNDDMISFE